MAVRRIVEDPDHPPVSGSSRRARGVAAAASAAVTVALVGAGLFWAAAAGATEPDPIPTVTPVASSASGNKDRCLGDPQAPGNPGLSIFEGTTLLSGDDDPGPYDDGKGVTGTVEDGKTLTVTVEAGITVTGIVVKGGQGSGYNTYSNPPTGFVGPIVITGMTTPAVQDISHWFVCGVTTPPSSEPPPSSSEPPPSSSEPPPSSSEPPPSSSEPPPSSSEPPPSSSEPPSTRPSLPVTGDGSMIGLILAGVALVVGGSMTLFFLRRWREAVE